ncbi:uncharacterized protein BYT42DRAFT_611582 [Radiomyces spectabilis]|uniref:uncharacterized protein n=1 Tax=Radiomyces spectabilis TaxID=64574 RepID=UPI002220C534|nr:uncharacterized protein BYT42DRAFT_611582 [Radiomyces spectabilis]KAI8388549.1 hypothetical protein BYT42DRAFT_611582 [Radiomyces spectabilis]
MSQTNSLDHKDRLLLVFIHGYRGSDTSFHDFPNRLRTILSNSSDVDVDSIVYPSYKTAGDLTLAVRNLSAWLCDLVQSQHKDMKRLQSKGHVMVVLIGHSMGGIVAAETILQLHSRLDTPLGSAKIIGLLAFDTPFYSVNHDFVSTTAMSSVEQVGRFLQNSSTQVSSSSSRTVTQVSTTTKKKSMGGWGLLAGVVGVAAVGAAAYMTRDKIAASVTDMYNELEFVSALTDMNRCSQRVRELMELPDILFRCFYVQLPNPDGAVTSPRTFIALPPFDTAHLFIPCPSNAASEVKAHTSMFNPAKSAHYYQLGNDTIALISEMIARYRRHVHPHTLTSSAAPHHQTPQLSLD